MSAGAKPIRVLFVEDSPDDVELGLAALRAAAFDPEYEVVDDGEGLRQALVAGPWDVVVSDYRMPGFSGLDALRILQELGLDTPFILVSGTVGEDVAVEAMRAGAQDYVLKGNVTRLSAAVARELLAAERRRHARLQQRWLELLAKSGQALSESLDHGEVMARIARVVANEVADACVIDAVGDALGGPRGDLVRTAAAHRDPSRQAELEALVAEHPPRPDAPEPAVLALEEDRTVVLRDIARDPAASRSGFVALARALGASSALAIPLKARGRTVGVMSLASAAAYDEVEIPWAEEIAQRAALAIDNAVLYAQAQAAVRLRDEFLAIASHELKTPLTALQLQLQGLRKLVDALPAERTDPRLPERLERTTRHAERLGALVDSLLDVTRLSTKSAQLTRARFDLCEIASEVIERMQGPAARAGCELRLSARSPVFGRWDRMRVEQVLMNLLSNALKYGPGEPVEIEVAREGACAVLRVSDHGIGIAQEDLERVFGKFERAAPIRHYGGLGLGLYVTRQIVEAHGGRVYATGAKGSGATFTVELPLDPPAEEGAA